jgi:hypothetical protein
MSSGIPFFYVLPDSMNPEGMIHISDDIYRDILCFHDPVRISNFIVNRLEAIRQPICHGLKNRIKQFPLKQIWIDCGLQYFGYENVIAG